MRNTHKVFWKTYTRHQFRKESRKSKTWILVLQRQKTDVPFKRLSSFRFPVNTDACLELTWAKYLCTYMYINTYDGLNAPLHLHSYNKIFENSWYYVASEWWYSTRNGVRQGHTLTPDGILRSRCHYWVRSHRGACRCRCNPHCNNARPMPRPACAISSTSLWKLMEVEDPVGSGWCWWWCCGCWYQCRRASSACIRKSFVPALMLYGPTTNEGWSFWRCAREFVGKPEGVSWVA